MVKVLSFNSKYKCKPTQKSGNTLIMTEKCKTRGSLDYLVYPTRCAHILLSEL